MYIPGYVHRFFDVGLIGMRVAPVSDRFTFRTVSFVRFEDYATASWEVIVARRSTT